MATLIDSYSEAQEDDWVVMAATGGDATEVGQSFTPTALVLDSCKWYLLKQGAPPGVVVANLYAHSGVFGTSSVPTGSALAVSDPLSASTIGSPALTTFSFSGVNRITLNNVSKYVIAVAYNSGDASNNVWAGIDISSPTHTGNLSRNLSGWSADNTSDAAFYVYGADPVLPIVTANAPVSLQPQRRSYA